MPVTRVTRPYAITMWEFSWIERRWPGAGYEDWDEALDELVERGYDAVRIDAFPHLIGVDPNGSFIIESDGQDGDWGAPGDVEIARPGPALVEFIAKCRDRGVMVGLSTWYKRDRDNVRMRIRNEQDQARVWADTLRIVRDAGLLDAILYVDLCNEFPNAKWAPYLYGSDEAPAELLTTPRLRKWMRDSIALLRAEFGDLDYTYSQSSQFDLWPEQEVSMLDFLEPHIWMNLPSVSSFNAEIGYSFRTREFQNFITRSRPHYFANKQRFDAALTEWIGKAPDWSKTTGKPLVTTESWAVVNYRDWPMADWGWVMDLRADGVEQAAATGRWTAICTSNFCGPQYRGMWRDIAWHRRLTDIIKSSPLAAEFRK